MGFHLPIQDWRSQSIGPAQRAGNSIFTLEHALAKDADGKVVVEQAYVDFLLSQPFNVRVGRVLTPLGIINKKHEPTTFNGVERPSFTHDIIPTTWPQDGIGAFGQITQNLSYEAYVSNGLDGSNMDPAGGLRGGRMTERPGLNDGAVSGRVDYQMLEQFRLGASGYVGGLDNSDQGGESGVDTNVRIVSADFEWSVQDFDLRGVIAHNKIDDGDELPQGVGEEMFGWYLEAAYHFWPQVWRTGKLENADATAFVRYDDWDTNHEMPSGVPADDSLDREEVTVGVDFKPVQNFVVKADYQFRDHEGTGDPADGFNLGVGWEF